MVRSKDILIGFLGGVIGGAVVDLIYISFVSPSALLSAVVGLTERYQVFLGHLFLGGIFGILFVVLLSKLARFNLNIWFLGISWGLFCMGLLGGVPSLFAQYPTNTIVVLSSLTVWLLYGLILTVTIKLLK